MWRLTVFLILALGGIWFIKLQMAPSGPRIFSQADLDTEFPLVEHKSFVIVLYAHNQEWWCKKALRSIFEQDYDHYRVVMIDDASIDATGKVAKDFIVANNQDEKVIFIRNETYLGPVASLYRMIDNCLDREIVIPLDAKDWFTSPNVLNRFNLAYQNPDVWMANGWAIEYPAYKITEEGPTSYYSALFKQIPLSDLFQKGRFATHPKSYLNALKNLSEGRIKQLPEPLGFLNLAPERQQVESVRLPLYGPLADFPAPRGLKKADIAILSEDRPLQLYACLESLQRYVSRFEQLVVLFRASEPFVQAYKMIEDAFPLICFASMQEGIKAIKSEYVLLGTDDAVVKDFVDLRMCVEQMEKTEAFVFNLELGRHISHLPPSQPLSFGIYAWDVEMGEGDWAKTPHLALYRRKTVEKFKHFKPELPKHPIGLYFEHSKSVNVSGNPANEMLAIFNQGLKINIEAFYKIENQSTHLNSFPEFILR